MLNWIVWNRTVYLYKNGLSLNNLQRLICHKTQTNKFFWHLNCILMLNWIAWNGIVFVYQTELFEIELWINWIVWNRNVFDN